MPIDGTSFATKAGFMLLADEAVVIRAGDRGRGAARGPQPARDRRSSSSPGTCSTARDDEHTEPVTLDELEQLVEQEAVEILDVREPDEHADGYIPGSRNVPYRLVARAAPTCSRPRSRS